MDAIIPKTNGELTENIGETTAVSWKPSKNLTFEGWEKVGNTLQTINGALNWWIGDWLSYGEQRYGETYSQALNVTDSSIESLKKYKAVSERVPFSMRIPALSWTHHLYVAYLPEEERASLLMIADAFDLTSRDLKDLAMRGDSERKKIVEAFEDQFAEPFASYEALLTVIEPEPQYELSDVVELIPESTVNAQNEDPDDDQLPFSDIDEEEVILENDTTVLNKFIDYFGEAGIYIVDTGIDFVEFDNGLSIMAELGDQGEAVLIWGIPLE